MDPASAPEPLNVTPTRLRILVTGARGLLGTDLCAELRSRGHDTIELDHKACDIGRPDDVELIRRQDYGRLDWIINCAAYTKVDQAEAEIMAANRVNGVGPGLLAYTAKSIGARFLHFSTDFVFDGNATVPYFEDSHPAPRTAYGRTKLFGEQNAVKENPDSVIIRTAWLYGASGKCFPRTMIEAWLAEKPLRVVNDQVGSPTSTTALARLVGDLIAGGIGSGVYHAAGPDAVSWHDFAVRAITAYRDLVIKSDRAIDVVPVPTSEFPTPAHRPAYSALSFEKLAGLGYSPMPSLDLSLAEFVSRLPSPLTPVQ